MLYFVPSFLDAVMKQENFDAVFQVSLERLLAEAKAVGLSVSALCRRAGASRTTPDRWRQQAPETIRLLAKMQTIVQEEKDKNAIPVRVAD